MHWLTVQCLYEPVCIVYACQILYFILLENNHIYLSVISMTWLLVVGGLETETEYPYKGVDEKCTFVRQDVRVYINGSVNISKNEDGRLLFLKIFISISPLGVIL